MMLVMTIQKMMMMMMMVTPGEKKDVGDDVAEDYVGQNGGDIAKYNGDDADVEDYVEARDRVSSGKKKVKKRGIIIMRI